MVDIKKMIKKTGHYPVKDRKTGRISLVRPKSGVDTKEKLEAAVDRFYYENDIEYRNPKNRNPLPRRLRGHQPAAHRASTSRDESYDDGGGESSSNDDDEDDDHNDHTASMSGSQASRGETDPGIRQTHTGPAYFDVDSQETSSPSQNSRIAPKSSQELEEGVRRMSFRAAPNRHTTEETSGRRRSGPHHAVYQINAHSAKPLTSQESGHNDVNITRTSSRSAKYGLRRGAIHDAQNRFPRNPLQSLDKLSRHYLDPSRPADAGSSAETGGRRISAAMGKQRQPQPNHDLKGSLSRAPSLVERIPLRAEASDRRRRKESEYAKPFCVELKSTKPLHQTGTELPTQRGLKAPLPKVAAQDQCLSNDTDNTGNLGAHDQTLAGPQLQHQYIKNGQSPPKRPTASKYRRRSTRLISGHGHG